MAAASPLRGKYLVRNPLANRLLAGMDALLARCRPGRPPSVVAPPRRILLANGAHLGDVLMATAVLPVLKESFPGVRIGFLIGSWARPVLHGHPLVDWVHEVDHWKLNRSPLSHAQKLGRYLATRRRALQAIRRRRYDIAIDLYSYFPNAIPLLWQAGIPVRIGYTSGGFGPLLTHALDWSVRDCHVIDYQADLLRFLPLNPTRLKRCGPVLANGHAEHEPPPAGDYVVLHPGAGAAIKEWPHPKWRALAARLAAAGHRLVFTGNSAAEQAMIRWLTHRLGPCLDLSGRLRWPEFVTVVRRARLLVGVDSVAGHVAAAVGTPHVVVGSGIPHPAHWRPRGGPGRVLTHPVPCAPCYNSRGCATMDCVRNVSVDQVDAAIQELLRSARAGERPC